MSRHTWATPPVAHRWVIFTRLVLPISLLGGAFAVPRSVLLWTVLGGYGLVNLAFLSSWGRVVADSIWTRLWLAALLALENIIISLLMIQDGGVLSDYSLLFVISATLAGFLFGRLGAVLGFAQISLLYAGLMASHWGRGLFPSLGFLPTSTLLLRASMMVGLVGLVGLLMAYLSTRIRVQQELLGQQARDLELARLDLDGVLNRLTYGVVVLDANFQVLYFNQAAGLVRHPLYPGANFMTIVTAEAWGDLLCRLLRSVREGVQPSGDAEVRTLSGGWLRLQVAVTYNEGQVRNLVVTMHDITAIRHMEDEVRNAERMSTLGHMAARIAHEIRNPLASITGSAQLLRDQPNQSEDDQHLLQLIRRESARLDRILTEFLDFSRPRSASFRELELLPVFEEVRELVLTRAISLGRDDVRVDIQSQTPGLRPKLDRDMLLQILGNLAINSLQAISDQRPPMIRLESELRDGNLLLRVRDNGLGMSADVLEHMGEAFFTTRQGGVGLGVAISQQLCALLGGTFRVQSKEGVGTLIEVAFPPHVIQR